MPPFLVAQGTFRLSNKQYYLWFYFDARIAPSQFTVSFKFHSVDEQNMSFTRGEFGESALMMRIF